MIKKTSFPRKCKVTVFSLLLLSSFYSAQTVTEQLTTFKKTELPPSFKTPAKPYSVARRLQNKGKTTITVDNKSVLNKGAELRKSSLSQTSSSKFPNSSVPNSNVPVEAVQAKSKNLD